MATAALSFRKLRVWQSALDLVEQIYEVTAEFPKSETYGLTSQMRRAAVSIAANISEGQMRDHLKEFLHFLSVARASLAELTTEAEIAGRLGYLNPTQLTALQDRIAVMFRLLYSLRNSLGSRSAPRRVTTNN